jgi:cell volume regulation protein A
MAVLLTVSFTHILLGTEELSPWLALRVVGELVIGAGGGALVGYAGRTLLLRAKLAAGGLYPVMTLALAMVAYGLTTLLHGSGFLGVYVAAVIIGNAKQLPYRAGLLRVHDAAAWVAQVGMFLVLGLLVTPHRLLDVAPLGLALGLVLAFVARPIAVALSVAPFGYSLKEYGYLSWVGLRGAVPIILAAYPVMAGAPGADESFHLVFFIVVVNALVPGSTIRFVTDRLGLRSPEPPPPAAVLEVTSTESLSGKVLAFHVDRASAASGVAIRDLPFPAETSVMLIVRAGALVAPRGEVLLTPGDHLYVITSDADEPLVRLIFGQQEEL